MTRQTTPAGVLSPMKASAVQEETARYIDLSSDVGFKIAFGNPDNPELILGLLQALLPERDIVQIEFLDGQIKPETITDKRVCFDIRCKEKNGSTFVVEMQKENYDYMVDRLVVYSGDPLKRLLKAGQSYGEIQPLYVICISNFIFKFEGDGKENTHQLVRTAKLHMDDTKEVLSNKLNFIFLQLPVVKKLVEGQSFLEQWAYAVRNSSLLKERPRELSGPYFDTMFKAADRDYINPLQLEIYDNMVRDAIQIQAEKDFAIREAVQAAVQKVERKAERRAERKAEARGEEKALAKSIAIAKALKAKQLDSFLIAECTGLTIQQVESL